MEDSEETNRLFEHIIRKMESMVVNEIERGLVTHITSDLNTVKALVVKFCNPNYMNAHVIDKVWSIDKDVDYLIEHLNNKRKKNWEEEEKEEERKLMKSSKWLHCIGKRTEKIKNMVSQFRRVAEGEMESSALTGGKREKQKTVSNSTECYKMCIQESLLISPISRGTLKKSYDHLPPNLKLCVLTLAAFPEHFIIKKRPLIYWWMAEGFVVATNGNSKSAEEVGEENFTQLIQLGLIQPWYESGNITDQPHNNVHVQGCSVHPWIRRMLVPIAMEARLFEIFGVPERHPPMMTIWNPRSRRVCLYDDVVDHTATWKTRYWKYHRLFQDRFKWIKVQCYRVQRGVDNKEFLLQMPKDIKEVSKRQNKLMMSAKFLTDLNDMVAEVAHGKVKHGSDDDHALLAAVNKRLIDLKARIDDAMKNNNDVGNNIKQFHDEQMKLQNEIEGLHKQFQVEHQMDYLDTVLDPNFVNDPVVYNRINNCETLQKNEEVLFGHNDLNNPFPYPMKKKNKRSTTTNQNEQQANKSDVVSNDEAAERLLAIINVSQKYLDMDDEPFGKIKNLRTLHLGRWRDSLPVPHVEVENGHIFEALFHVAKHLKYLSLRGISRITTLPSTISKCCNLQILDLKACYNLETLPSEISKLYKLTHFDVSECYFLQNTNLWSLVQHLHCLQTLKGLKVDQSNLNSLPALAASGTLRKLSIILTTPNFNIHLLTTLSKLCILTITWRITTVKKPTQGGASTDHPPQQQTDIEEALPNLKKLDLRCYPDKDWPNWAKKHSSLETLYITGGDLEEFPMADLHLPTLQLLRFKYLTKLKLGADNTPQPKSTIFPSLITFLNHNSKSKK
nr:disease resistance RPP13-like protein 4 [Ipomoea batatas]GMD36880.1 disease resistance RPP13-like protein 4 [Ipomoea batatas]